MAVILVGLVLGLAMLSVPFVQNVREFGWPWAPHFLPDPEPTACVTYPDGRYCIINDNPSRMPG